MDLVCSSCEARFRVADEKLPDSKRFGVRCPRCGNKIVVDRAQENAGDAHSPSKPIVPNAKKVEDVLEFFPPGAIVAFVALPEGDFRTALIKALGRRGVHVSEGSTQERDKARLMINTYQMVFLADNEHGQECLKVVHSWTGYRRREINVAMVGNNFPSLDQNEAFRLGVNFYMNFADNNRMDELLDTFEKGFEVYLEIWNKARRNIENS